MIFHLLIVVGSCFALCVLDKVQAQPTAATYISGDEIPVTSNGFIAAGKSVNFALNYAPSAGTQLMVVNNTSLGFISGTFSNLAQGQVVALSYAGTTYHFVANYYGGNGNDLVLQWSRRRLFAWGNNGYGQLGINSTLQSPVPVAVMSTGVIAGKTVIAMAVGSGHSLALCSDGTLAAWGENSYGQLGNNSKTNSSVPVMVDGSGALLGKTVVAVSAGNACSLALCSDGTVVSWGWNGTGQLGNGANGQTNSLVPVLVYRSGVLAGKTIIAISAGEIHCVALCSDGTVVAWGNNSYGQLGNNSVTSSYVPVATTLNGVLAGKSVVSVAAGGSHTVALCSDGTTVTWGANDLGQLGNGGANFSIVPVEVTRSGALAGKTVVAVAAGAGHCLAQCSDGTMATWGWNLYGQLGNSNMAQSNLPVALLNMGVLMGKTVATVATGKTRTLALCFDGTLAAWGRNDFSGNLGNNSSADSSVPVAVTATTLAPGERFVSLFAGSIGNHNLALVAIPEVPTVLGISPSSGSGAGGTSVTITGTSFTGATSVTIGGSEAAGVSINSDTSITAITPQGSAGPASVVVATSASGPSAGNTFYTYMAPNISVAQNSNVLSDGTGGVSFVTTILSPISRTFTIINSGNQALTGLGVTEDGPNAADFTVSALSSTSIADGAGMVTFSVTFSPRTAGFKTAAIHIASNMTGSKNPFDILFTAQSLSSAKDTDGDGLDDASEFRLAAEGFDWQVNQAAKVTAFKSNLTLSGFYTADQLQALNLSTPLIQKIPGTGQFKLVFGLQKSSNLKDFTPFPLTAPQVLINGEGKIEFNFTPLNTAEFYRIEGQ